MNYTFIDIETPNAKNDTICSISLIETDGEHILSTYSSLVNPEAAFYDKNMTIHHITPGMVKNKPTLFELWPSISHYFENHIIGGHNVTFDISAVKKHLAKYEIQLPDFDYICTMKMARSISDIFSYSLDSLCKQFDIALEHHNSDSDVLASFELFKRFINSYQCDASKFISNSSTINSKSSSKVSGVYLSAQTVKMQQLKAYIAGLLADNELEINEIIHLKQQLDYLVDDEKEDFYFSKIYTLVTQIWEDGVITKYEQQDLYALLNEFLNPVASNCSINKSIIFENNIFCLSGNFEYGSKSDVENIITQRGGICKNSVTLKTTYLIVGGSGSESWRMGNFGTKVEKALSLQDKGSAIEIIKESDFFEALNK